MGLENIRYITGFYWDWTDILVDSKLVNGQYQGGGEGDGQRIEGIVFSILIFDNDDKTIIFIAHVFSKCKQGVILLTLHPRMINWKHCILCVIKESMIFAE